MNFETLLEEKYDFVIKPQQREAALHAGGPALLLGVPGSGKTVAVALRCANLILCHGIAPKSILTLTYDKLTREDILARLRAIFGEDFPQSLPIYTPVELCGLVMKEYASLMKTDPPRIIEGSKRRLLRGMHAQCNDGEYLPDNRLDALVNAIGHVKRNRVAGENADLDGCTTVNNFDRTLSSYDAYMDENNCVDYDEMHIRALAALDACPALLERFRKQFSHINVDEAQEISSLQFEILKKLAAPANNLFMAGDADQCIYAGRAASPKCMEEFSRVYPETATYRMDRNYRSTHAIADAASRLIRQNFSRRIVTMNTGNEIGLPVEDTLLEDYGLLADHIVTRLKDKAAEGSATVLYRMSSTAAVVADALDREGIPFRLRGQKLAFFDHWVVQDILAFLALGRNPADIASLKRIYRKCNTYIGKDAFSQAESLMGQGSGVDALDALLLSPGISGSASLQLKRLKENIACLPGMPPDKAVRYILEKLEYGNYLKRACGEGMYLGSLLQTADGLASIASRAESYSGLSCRVGELAGIFENAGDGADPRAVTLMPVHAAKGAEFHSVFVLDLHEGSFPAYSAVSENVDGKKDSMEGERRLLYMAITRASKYVELVHARKLAGSRAEPSRFIREMLPRSAPRRARPDGPGRKPTANTLPASRTGKKQASRKPDLPKSMQPSPSPVFEQFALENGMAVKHLVFGEGVISAYDVKRDTVTIRFDKCGLRKLAASYSMSNGVLRKLEKEIGSASPG